MEAPSPQALNFTPRACGTQIPKPPPRRRAVSGGCSPTFAATKLKQKWQEVLRYGFKGSGLWVFSSGSVLPSGGLLGELCGVGDWLGRRGMPQHVPATIYMYESTGTCRKQQPKPGMKERSLKTRRRRTARHQQQEARKGRGFLAYASV